MKAVGIITDRLTVDKKCRFVNLFTDGKWADYALSNEDAMPDMHPSIGLFSFMPEDQFCKWIDPNKNS